MASGTRAGLATRNGSSVLRVLVLIAFCLQSFLVQTHVHPLGAASGPATISISAPHDGKAPLDADHCLLCQEYVHAGAYVTPAAAAVLPPSIAVSVVALSEAPFLLARQISRNWMGRAPPRA